ncbi:hypothetical protein [Actinomadura formosensis]|uniref:hypothetical protein n=1 Tax=Actinomadura formosensis TaxID=60706 RepID=UPI000A81D754|nr:hypothetical protein [Actinomadura formosensis]
MSLATRIHQYFAVQEVPEFPTLPDEEAAEVAKEYWLRTLRADETSRTRAQTAYAITSALSTVGIGVFFTAGMAVQVMPTKILIVLAIMSWTAATFLYLAAVSSSNKPDDANSSEDGDQQPGSMQPIDLIDLANAGMMEVQETRSLVVAWLRRANAASFAAIVFAVAAFLVSAFYIPKKEIKATILVEQVGASALSSLCGERISTLEGTVDSESLKDTYVTIKINKRSPCFGSRKMTIQRAWVNAVVSDK